MAPFMDRDKVTKPTAQIGFIKFVLIPMFETMAKVHVRILQGQGQLITSHIICGVYLLNPALDTCF